MSLSEMQQELQSRLLEEHLQQPHADLSEEQLRLHVALHVVVETQLALEEPPESVRTLARLMTEGLERHQAVHAISQAVSEEMLAVSEQQRPYSQARYVERLQQLSAADILGDEPSEEGGA